MEYIRITRDNIDAEHVCCAMSGKQALAKKEWLKRRFDEGLIFYRSVERGKCFIEYIPVENAWVPIQADGYLYIDCLWVAGSMKGHGYSNDLLRKREFLSDAKYLAHKGFMVADTSSCGIMLMYLPFGSDTEPPQFNECAKYPMADGDGFVLYYTDQCPFTHYWVPRVEAAAEEHSIPLKTIHIISREQAQNTPAPVTTYALFKDGEFLTQGIQSDKKFLKLAGVQV